MMKKACDINTVLIFVHLMIVTPGGPGPLSLNIGGATGPPGPPFPTPLKYAIKSKQTKNLKSV